MVDIIDREYPKSKTFKDISGMTFGRLYVDSYYGKSARGDPYFKCICECKNEVIVSGRSLRCGDIVSCGCYHKDDLSKRFTKHGLTSHPLYWVHHGFMQRCYNSNHDEYHNYGERGIYVCDEWKNKENGFMNFYNWAINNGYQKSLSIDRIDVNGPYSPENCRWVTIKLQNVNKRKSRFISLVMDFSEIGKGKIIYTYTASMWSKITGIDPNTILRRIEKYGWSIEKTLSTISNNKSGKTVEKTSIIIPQEYLQYNQPDKFDQSLHN